MAFAKDFLWGAATASHQVEGAYNEDGKCLSTWDALSEGRIAFGDNANVSCDHYHKFREDVALMKKMGLKSYRFSISWGRIFPDATGVVNEKGLNFYSELVDELKNAGIEPLVTLFHWDLPMWLHDMGGWQNPEIIKYYTEYAKTMVEALSDRVTYFITFNEPSCFIDGGYGCGAHAPYLTNDKATVDKITRIALLAHGEAVKVMRAAAKRDIKIGMAPVGLVYTPLENTEEAIRIAKEKTFSSTDPYFVNWWYDPVVLGKRIPDQGYLSDEDLEIISQPLDFAAYNIYHSGGYDGPRFSKSERSYHGFPRTGMDWPITPDCMYWSAKFVYERYGLPVIITENGMSIPDVVMLDGKVHDPQRIDFMARYLSYLKKATDEGVEILGYQHWSLMDNFEWTFGYTRRFGLIFVDYTTGERIFKDSAYFYADIIKTNGENL